MAIRRVVITMTTMVVINTMIRAAMVVGVVEVTPMDTLRHSVISP